MKVFENGVYPGQRHAYVEGSANATTTLTITADASHFWTLEQVTFSADTDPDSGVTLTITIGSTVVFKHFITKSGPGPIPLRGLARGVKNEAVTITASAAGTGKKVNLSAVYR